MAAGSTIFQVVLAIEWKMRSIDSARAMKTISNWELTFFGVYLNNLKKNH